MMKPVINQPINVKCLNNLKFKKVQFKNNITNTVKQARKIVMGWATLFIHSGAR